jgi:Do/DeqQ family serine protease
VFPLAVLVFVALGLGFLLHALLTEEPPRLGQAAKTGPPPGLATGDLQSAFVTVADRVRPAVVNIGTVQHSRGRRPFGFDQPFPDDPFFRDFFRDFFGEGPRGEFRQSSLGSGVIFDRRGYILTNFHVIKGADEITVRFSDKHEVRGRIVGSDPKTDLAVVRIQVEEKMAVAALGDSDRLRVGEWAIAIGNPFGLDQTVTVGVISATGRSDVGIATYENFIQTDASINPGNSGGPLVNLRGDVIGINTAIVASGQGIGFAIPVNMAKRIIEQLIEKGRVARGWLGFSLQPLTAELAQSLGAKSREGALVASVASGGPAEKAGLQQGDLILTYDGSKVDDPQHLQRLIAESQIGKTVSLTYLRKGKSGQAQAKVEEMPAEDRVRGQRK